MAIVLFEDEWVPRLYPVTTGKGAFAIGCGSYRLLDHVLELGVPVRAAVRPHLRELLAMEPWAAGAAPGKQEPVLFVNARLVPSVALADQLRAVLSAGQPCLVRAERAVALALVAPGQPGSPANIPTNLTDLTAVNEFVQRLNLPPLELNLPMFEYPHDVVRHHLVTLGGSLERRLANGNYQEVADGVFIASQAKLGQYVVSDTSKGPILLDERASVGPYTYLSGPAYLGPGARVIEHAAIKDCVALGHTTKIGGEVEGSIIEPYTNKQHHGFLGHSYLGSWINLGAGTCNSDLKNTYGQVNMDYGGQKVSSGMQFIGCIAGDYAKTAINTGIFTGKTVGACSMIYGFVTTNVPSFVNYARSFGQVTEASVDVMVAAQARMFARREVTQRPCDVQLLHAMYELTRHERQIAGEPLSL